MNIFTKYSAFFAAPFLADALNAPLYIMKNGKDSSYKLRINNNAIYCGDNTENINNDDITIITTMALMKISKRIEKHHFNRVNFIASDTHSHKEYMWWNKFVIDNNIHVYIMPDLEPFCFVDYKPIYQYIKINNKLIVPKSDRLLITHSPRSENKYIAKGSNAIINVIKKLQKKYDFDFKLIMNLTVDNAIREKSMSHIFIDQLIYKNTEINQKRFGGKIIYNGGLGKSGIEAMIMNCCTITGGIPPQTLPHFECPPITWTSYDKFYEDLENLIINETKRNKQIEEQNKWLSLYHNKEFYQKYLTT